MKTAKTLKIVAACAALLAGVLSLTCSPGYVLRLGIEEARILARRQPIAEVAAHPSTSEEERRKLDLVVQARTFSAEALGLDAGRSYTTFSRIDKDTLLMVVSASERDRFRARTWWFPIVGRIPYRGYFRARDALAEARRLEAQGLDAYVRPSGAFSTLGWFNDPLLSTVLRAGPVSLVETVIHELTHNTLFLPGQANFNESFASFVGGRGAADYFCALEGERSPPCRQALALWEDQLVFGAFLSELVAELEALYAREDLSREEKLSARETVFERARERFRSEVQPELRVARFESFLRAPLNNATLIARRVYYDRLDLFERVYRSRAGDLPATVAAIIAAAESLPERPYEAVEELIAR